VVASAGGGEMFESWSSPLERFGCDPLASLAHRLYETVDRLGAPIPLCRNPADRLRPTTIPMSARVSASEPGPGPGCGDMLQPSGAGARPGGGYEVTTRHPFPSPYRRLPAGALRRAARDAGPMWIAERDLARVLGSDERRQDHEGKQRRQLRQAPWFVIRS
jgi:hypothetical protein